VSSPCRTCRSAQHARRLGAAGPVFLGALVAERGGAPPTLGGTPRRYRVSERTSVSFATNVGDYAVSADGKAWFTAVGAARA
jgi:hypothetical protein